MENPFLDAWFAGSKTLFEHQSEWLAGSSSDKNFEQSQYFFNIAEESWKQCESQYQAWVSSAEQWLEKTQSEQGLDSQQAYKNSINDEFKAFKSLLSPNVFFQSGVNGFERVVQQLVNGPEFADIGNVEKEFIAISADWKAFQSACADYQTIIASSWATAFSEFTEKINSEQLLQSQSQKELLSIWLSQADKALVDMQRSDDFLKAQRNLVSASTKFKQKQTAMVEAWCESISIPTRSEIDDVHKVVYELRREIRQLKQEINKLKKSEFKEGVELKKGQQGTSTKKVKKDSIISKKPTAKKKASTAKKKASTTKSTNKKTPIKPVISKGEISAKGAKSSKKSPSKKKLGNANE